MLYIWLLINLFLEEMHSSLFSFVLKKPYFTGLHDYSMTLWE